MAVIESDATREGHSSCSTRAPQGGISPPDTRSVEPMTVRTSNVSSFQAESANVSVSGGHSWDHRLVTVDANRSQTETEFPPSVPRAHMSDAQHYGLLPTKKGKVVIETPLSDNRKPKTVWRIANPDPSDCDEDFTRSSTASFQSQSQSTDAKYPITNVNRDGLSSTTSGNSSGWHQCDPPALQEYGPGRRFHIIQTLNPPFGGRPFSKSTGAAGGGPAAHSNWASHQPRTRPTRATSPYYSSPLVSSEKIIFVTSDSERYMTVDLSGATTAAQIRELILNKVHIYNDDESNSYAIYRAEIGPYALGDALTNDCLEALCREHGDSRGTLKFLVTHPFTSHDERPTSQLASRSRNGILSSADFVSEAESNYPNCDATRPLASPADIHVAASLSSQPPPPSITCTPRQSSRPSSASQSVRPATPRLSKNRLTLNILTTREPSRQFFMSSPIQESPSADSFDSHGTGGRNPSPDVPRRPDRLLRSTTQSLGNMGLISPTDHSTTNPPSIYSPVQSPTAFASLPSSEECGCAV